MKYFLIALQFLTRIPVKISDKIEDRDYGYSMAWFPAVGLILGWILALAFKLAIFLFNPAITVVLVTTIYMFLTGAMHIDGLSDACDGLYGGRGDKKGLTSPLIWNAPFGRHVPLLPLAKVAPVDATLCRQNN